MDTFGLLLLMVEVLFGSSCRTHSSCSVSLTRAPARAKHRHKRVLPLDERTCSFSLSGSRNFDFTDSTV